MLRRPVAGDAAVKDKVDVRWLAVRDGDAIQDGFPGHLAGRLRVGGEPPVFDADELFNASRAPRCKREILPHPASTSRVEAIPGGR